MPGRPREVREEARHPPRRALARAFRRPPPLGARRRAGMAELVEVVAGRLVRRRAVLRVARNQVVQDARARPAVQVSRLHALPRVRWRAAQARGAALAPRHQGGRRSRARSGGAVPTARHRVRRSRPRRAPRAHAARPGAAADRIRAQLLRGAIAARAARRGSRSPARRDTRAARLPRRRGPLVPHARPPVAHAFRRRGAAHQPHHRARDVARQYIVRARRAVHRSAPARHRARGRPHAPLARRGQLAGGGRARSADHRCRRPRAGHRSRPRRARRGDRVLRDTRRAVPRPRIAHRRLPRRAQACGRAPRRFTRARSARRAGRPRCERAQPEAHRRRDPAQRARLRHRRLRFRQVHARARRAVPGAAARPGQADRSARCVSRARRRGAHRRRGAGRPGPHRAHDALQSGKLCRRIRLHPQALCRNAAREGARVYAGHVQLQCGQRPLPDVRRQRLRARRDAIPVGRVPALPGLRWHAVPGGGARSEARWPIDRGRARHDGEPGARALRRRARHRVRLAAPLAPSAWTT